MTSTSSARTHRLSSTAAVLDAIPHLVGFRPFGSLVVIALDGTRVALTARLDLPHSQDEATDAAPALSRAAHCAGATRALLVVFLDPDCESHPGIEAVLDAVGVIAARLTADGLEVAEPLLRRDADLRTVTGRPAGTLALDGIVRGQVVHADRDALTRSLRPGDGPDRAVTDERARLYKANPSVGQMRQMWGRVFDTATRPTTGLDGPDARHPVGAGEVALAALALRDTPIRDEAVLRVCAATTPLLGLEDLLTRVCRTVGDLDVAPAACLLGIAAYLRGDGALARCATDRALEADPGYTLARLVQTSLDLPLTPAQVREAITGTPTTGGA